MRRLVEFLFVLLLGVFMVACHFRGHLRFDNNGKKIDVFFEGVLDPYTKEEVKKEAKYLGKGEILIEETGKTATEKAILF